MKRILMVAVAVAAVLPWLSGCGKSDKASARAPAESTPAEKIITRWKEPNLKVPGYGLIIEQEGDKLSAGLYRVEPSDGFVIKEKAADGKYDPERKQFIFPLYLPGFVSVDDWIAADGTRVIVPLDPQATSLVTTTNLVGELKDPARKSTYNFVRLPAEALPSVLNTSSLSGQ